MSRIASGIIRFARFFAWCAAVLLLSPFAWAQADVVEAALRNERPKIGLVLSGGGARGAAHVGVLKVLEELRIPIDFVAGNSMGALVGGNFAFGHSPAELQRVLETVNWPLVLSDGSARNDLTFRRKQDDSSFLIDYEIGLRGLQPVLPLGIAQGNRALNILKFLNPGWTEFDSFDELPIPFRAVATDIADGSEVLLQSGSLPLALAASMAIPGVFAPVAIDGRELIDGMVVNNVPIGVALKMGADVLIVVDVGTPILKANEITSMLKVTSQMLNLLMQANIDEQFDLIDEDDRHTIVRPPLGKLESGDFTRISEAIEIGELAARGMLSELSRYSVSEAEYERFLAKQRRKQPPQPVVDRIVIVNQSGISDGAIRLKMNTRVGEPLDVEVLKADLDRIFGTEEFERVSFEFPKLANGEHELRILADEKSWGPNYLKFGLNLEDDFSGASQYNIGIDYTMRALNELGGEWRTGAQIGELVEVRTEFYQPLDESGRFFVAPSASYSDSNLLLQDGTQLLARLDVEIGTAALDAGVNFSNWGELRMGFAYLRGLVNVRASVAPFADFGFNDAVLRTRFTADTLDYPNFPTSGNRLDVVWDVGRQDWGADTDYQDIRSLAVNAGSYGRTTGLLIGSFNSKLTGNLPVYKSNSVGGFLNLSGLERGTRTGERSARVAAIAYNQFAGARDVLFGFPTYIGLSLEAANATDQRDELFSEPLFGASVFIGVDLPIAPLYIGYGRAEGGEQSLYLFLGQTF